jgi:hypothetical protein
MDRWTDGQVHRWTGGQMDRWIETVKTIDLEVYA